MLWGTNICRICTQTSEICIPIFEKDSSEALETKIRRCLLPNLSKDDLKPKQICQDCSMKLNDFYNFFTLFHDSNYRFESMLYTNGTPTVGLGEEYVDLDLSLVAASQPQHKSSMMGYKDDMIPLENLDVRDFNEQTIINEIVKQTDVNIDDMQSFTTTNNMLVEMPSEASYLDLDLVDNEMAVSNERGFKEPACNRKKRSLISVQDICREVEKQQKLFQTPIKSRSRRLKHPRVAKPKQQSSVDSSDYEEQIFTNILNQVFETNPNPATLPFQPNFYPEAAPTVIETNDVELNAFHEPPVRKHSTAKPSPAKHACKECGKSFARRYSLNEHIKKHDSARPYVCDICSKTFAVQWDLTFHKRIHSNIYCCSYCNKSFSAPSKLQRHVRTHTGERPFVCTYENCGRSFSDKRNLIGHEITHTNVRKFGCNVCKRSYKTKNQLKEHMQAHSDVPAFRCEVCNKSYRWKTNLIIHMKKHSGYVCSVCDMKCGKRSEFVKHKKECRKVS